MKRRNFFSWYVEQSLHDLLEIWKNILAFLWRFFAITHLLATLLAPWKKDIAIRNWRGLHIGKSLQLLYGNLFSRIIGLIVRMLVFVSGLMVMMVWGIVGPIFLVFWIGAPVLALFLLFMFRGNTAVLIGVFSGCWFWVIMVAASYFFYRARTPKSDDVIKNFHLHKASKRLAERFGIQEDHFPQEIIENPERMDDFLKQQNISLEEFNYLLNWELTKEVTDAIKRKPWRKENLEKIQPLGVQWGFAYTIRLDRYSADLSEADYSEYADIELVGRKDEFDLTKLILGRPDDNCVLLVGASGIGKKTLVHHFARTIRENAAERSFSDSRVLLLDLGRAISDAVAEGEDVENVVRMLFYEAAYAGNVILMVEHFENFLGNEASMFHPNLSAVFSEYLGIPTLQIIATSTPHEYHQMIERQGEILKHFEVVEMHEPDDNQTLEIVLGKLAKYEEKRVLFTYEALKAIIRESGKINWDIPMPERAIDLTMNVLMYWEKSGQEAYISEKSVVQFIAMKTGIPQGEIGGDEKKKLLNLEKILHNFVIGQEEAVTEVAQALRRARSGIGNAQKPIGSFLLLGPTGVGKTETAKALARAYFGDEKRMIRLDMSEFQSPGSLDHLIGSTQLNQKGRLTTQIKDNPYSLLLLDEIEKAYPEILDIFLQILDEGFVTDAFGEKINFRNCIIIATSNAGAPLIKTMVEGGSSAEEIKQAIIDYTVKNGIYRLEFLNRFTGVVFFRPLNDLELRSVVRLLLQKFAARLNKEKNIEIAFEESLIDDVIRKGYNPIFGARSLDHYIEHTIEDIVATKIISGELKRGEILKI